MGISAFLEKPLRAEALEPYDYLMEEIVNFEGASVDQEQMEALMNLVAYHESDKTMDPSTIQKSNVKNEKGEVIGSKEGPGRGLYQYEITTGSKQGGGRTAMNRLLTAYGGERNPQGAYSKLPNWAKEYFDVNNDSGYPNPKGDVDFSELTEEQQKILFLADKLIEPNAIKDIGQISATEWWAKHHHKGTESNVQGFSNDAMRYLKGEFRRAHNIDAPPEKGEPDYYIPQ